MSRIKKAALTGILTVGLVTSGAGLASAAITEEEVGGGTWRWGTTASTAQSHYYHGSKCHGATAAGSEVVRAEADAGSWARATASRAETGNEAYWRNTC